MFIFCLKDLDGNVSVPPAAVQDYPEAALAKYLALLNLLIIYLKTKVRQKVKKRPKNLHCLLITNKVFNF
jgi:hypothetical protein